MRINSLIFLNLYSTVYVVNKIVVALNLVTDIVEGLRKDVEDLQKDVKQLKEKNE